MIARRVYDNGPRCSKCGCNLTGLTEPRCPECGTAVPEHRDGASPAANRPPSTPPRGWLFSLPLLLVVVLCIVLASLCSMGIASILRIPDDGKPGMVPLLSFPSIHQLAFAGFIFLQIPVTIVGVATAAVSLSEAAYKWPFRCVLAALCVPIVASIAAFALAIEHK